MDPLLNLQIQHGDMIYTIDHRIGSWGPNFQFPVYQCQVHPPTPPKALKILPRINGGEAFWEAANAEIMNMTDLFMHPGFQTPILVFDEQFEIVFNDAEYLCIVLPYAQALSMRRVLHDDNGPYTRGLPIPCIRRALFNVVQGLHDLHEFDLHHGQLTTSDLCLTDTNIKLGALCTTYVQDLPDLPALAPEFMRPNQISFWGRAPEYDIEEEEAAAAAQPPQLPPLEPVELIAAGEGDILEQLEEMEMFFKKRRDIWNIGVVALELGYGQIQVINRNQFLNAINFIQQHSIVLPNTWNQLLENTEAQMPIHQTASRFNNIYISFIRTCLRAIPEDRPDIDGVREHQFLSPHRMITELKISTLGLHLMDLFKDRTKPFEY